MLLLCYVSEYSDSWNKYVEPLTRAYNFNVHRATGTRPLYLLFLPLPPEFNLHYDDSKPAPDGKDRTDFLEQLQKAITKS